MNVIQTVGALHKTGSGSRQSWRVWYVTPDGRRRAKYLGPAAGPKAVSKREADRLVARWLVEVGADPGKATGTKLPTLAEHIEHYLGMARPRYGARTTETIERTCRYLVAFFGPDRRLNTISRTEAENWFTALVEGTIGQYLARREGHGNGCKAGGLADATVKHHIDNARHLFLRACRRFPDQIRENPFADIRIKPKPTKGIWRFVRYDEAVAAIDACTDQYTSRIGWQVFIALQRFAGLRKGEALALEKQDVDLTADPMTVKVYGSKTARAKREASRVVPVLFPILADLLVKAIGETGPGERFVVDSRVTRNKGSDHKTLCRILRRAGLERWRPGFQVLRACAERDFLDLGLSEYRYTRAIGHSPAVSRAHYLARFEGAVLDDDERDEFRAAAERAKQLIAGGAGHQHG